MPQSGWCTGAYPLAVRLANRIIAVSRTTADDLVRWAEVPTLKIEVVSQGLDPVLAAPSAAAPAADQPA